MTKFDEMFAEYIQKQSKPDPELFICDEKTVNKLNEELHKLNEEVLRTMGVITFSDYCMHDLLDGSAKVEIRGPWVPYSQEIGWENVDFTDKENNHEHH